MSRAFKIPPDIMALADNIAACSMSEGIGRDVLAGNVARALRDERERCARVADGVVSQDDSWDNSHWNQCAKHIAIKIRKK